MKFLDQNGLRGAHIAMPMHPYRIELGLGAARIAVMNDAIAVMQSLGTTQAHRAAAERANAARLRNADIVRANSAPA